MQPQDIRKRGIIEHFIEADEIDVHTRRGFIQFAHILVDWSPEFLEEINIKPELEHLREDYVLPRHNAVPL
jgi:hypothetical protein